VVDDAIIVVESVQHIDEQKMSAKEATYRAMKIFHLGDYRTDLAPFLYRGLSRVS
jgi:hypothetical protein